MLLSLLELSPPPTHFAVVLDARGKTFRCALHLALHRPLFGFVCRHLQHSCFAAVAASVFAAGAGQPCLSASFLVHLRACMHHVQCRHEIYEGYKGQRQACPDAVKAAVPRLQALLKAMAIPVIQVGPAPTTCGWSIGRRVGVAGRCCSALIGNACSSHALCEDVLPAPSMPPCAGARRGGGRRDRHYGAAGSGGVALPTQASLPAACALSSLRSLCSTLPAQWRADHWAVLLLQ
jgi:hypothetical protein